MNRSELIKIAWQTGNLTYKVREYQDELWAKIQEVVQHHTWEPFVLNCSRRFGKSTLGMLALIQEALKYPGTSYIFVAPTEGHAKEIVLDVTPVLIQDAPDEFKPVFKNGRFSFPNGSEIRIGGAYNGGESLRGRRSESTRLNSSHSAKSRMPSSA